MQSLEPICAHKCCWPCWLPPTSASEWAVATRGGHGATSRQTAPLCQSTAARLTERPRASSKHGPGREPIPPERWACSVKTFAMQTPWKGKNPNPHHPFPNGEAAFEGWLVQKSCCIWLSFQIKACGSGKRRLFFFSFHKRTSHAAALARKRFC